MWDWDYLIRVMFAGLCGALIGYERKSRMKEAGIRTHFIVGIDAAAHDGGIQIWFSGSNRLVEPVAGPFQNSSTGYKWSRLYRRRDDFYTKK